MFFNFKMRGSSKDPEEIISSLSSADKVANTVKLKAFSAFEGTADAVAATTDIVEGKVGCDDDIAKKYKKLRCSNNTN